METKQDFRNELAKKRDEWFETKEAQFCLAPDNFYGSKQKYLKNRIETAWLAGERAAEELFNKRLERITQVLLGQKLDNSFTEEEALVEISKIVSEDF